MKADQERVSKLLTDTVTLLCKNGLVYKDEIMIQGLLGITLDKSDVFLVKIDETIGGGGTSSDGPSKKGAPASNVPVVDLTRVADTPMIPTQMRGMGPMMPGMNQPPTAGGGMGARKQRGMMPQMMPRGQYMPMQRFRMGMPPANMQAMASQMNNHMMYSRQPGNMQMMPPNMRMRMPMPPQQHAPPSRRQQTLPPATVAIDDDEDVVIIGTGHEEPSPNWNSPGRRNHPGRSNSQQVPAVSTGQAKGSSISLSTPSQGSSAGGSGFLADVDQPPITVTLNENILDEQNGLEISLSEISKDGDGRPKLVSVMGAEGVDGTQLGVTAGANAAAPAMLIEPNDQDSEGDNSRSSVNRNAAGDAGGEQHSSQPTPMDESGDMSGKSSADLKIDTKTDPDQPGEASLSSASDTATKHSDSTNVVSQDSPKITLVPPDQANGSSKKLMLPVVYTDIAVEPELMQFEGGHVTDMDIQTLGFDILTEDDHDVTHSSSQMTSWNCKIPGCSTSFPDAVSLATHYHERHSDRLVMLPSSCSPFQAGDSTSEGSDRGSSDSSSRKKLNKAINCPFAGCKNKFSSWPGLILHHKKMHGTALSLKERKAIVAIYGKPFKCTFLPDCQKSYMTKRELVRHIAKAHEAHDESDSSSVSIPISNADGTGANVGSDEPEPAVDAEASTSEAKSFLCLVTNCDVVCSSREALIDHLQTCHQGAASALDNTLSAGVKEETVEDQ